MTRVITLPAVNKTVSLRAYIQAVRLAKENPAATFSHGFTTWWPTTGADIMRQFRQGVMDRINQAIPYYKRGLSARYGIPLERKIPACKSQSIPPHKPLDMRVFSCHDIHRTQPPQ